MFGPTAAPSATNPWPTVTQGRAVASARRAETERTGAAAEATPSAGPAKRQSEGEGVRPASCITVASSGAGITRPPAETALQSPTRCCQSTVHRSLLPASNGRRLAGLVFSSTGGLCSPPSCGTARKRGCRGCPLLAFADEVAVRAKNGAGHVGWLSAPSEGRRI